MHILITGASGFVGGRLTEYLLNQGYDVLATGRSKLAVKRLEAMGAEYRVGNLLDADFVASLVKEVDAVVHAAALSATWGSYQRFYMANVEPTHQLLEAALASDRDIRFIQVSSGSVYVQMQHQLEIQEDFVPTQFINHYAATKHKADQLVLQAIERGLSAIILRPRAIYGRGDFTIMPRVLRAYHAGRLKVIGKGNTICSMTTIQNFCEAVELAVQTQKPEAIGQIYNITNAEPTRLWDMIAKVFEGLGLDWKGRKIPFWVIRQVAQILEIVASLRTTEEEPVLTQYAVGQLYYSNTFSIEKAKRLLNYAPSQSNMEGLQEFVDWWKKREGQQLL